MTAPRNNIPKTSSVSEWKKRPDPIELPSGKFMVIKGTSLSTFVQSGQIPNALMAVIQSSVKAKKKAKSESDLMGEIVENPEMISDLFQLVDAYICLVAIEPRVYPVPVAGGVRDDDLLYADEIDAEDKMFLFNRSIGGTASLESFRRELASGVDLVQQREDVVKPTKRAPRNR